MSHHSQQPWSSSGNPSEDTFNKESELINMLRENNQELGATGQFPNGKINPTDEGEIMFRVGSDSGKVILDFGEKPTAWVGMTPQQAVELAQLLIRHARNISTEPLKVQLY